MIKNNLLAKIQRIELNVKAHFGGFVKQRREDLMAFPFPLFAFLIFWHLLYNTVISTGLALSVSCEVH